MNRKIFAALLAAVMMLASCAALAENPTAMPVPEMTMSPASITVQGTAQVMADPDQVTVTANASVAAGTVGSAQ